MRFKLKPLSFKVHEWVDGIGSWQNIYGYSNIALLSLSLSLTLSPPFLQNQESTSLFLFYKKVKFNLVRVEERET